MITEKELLTQLQDYANSVSDHMDSDAANDRANLMKAYFGERYGNERDGFSSVVTREVYQVVENTVADVAEMFVADEETVRFEPEGPEDIEPAKQATDYVSYVFYRENDGYGNTIDALRDGVLQRFGVIKRWWDNSTVREHHTFNEISEEAYAVLKADPEVEVTDFELEEDELTGQRTVSGSLIREKECGKTCVQVVASENFKIHESAATVEEAAYLREEFLKTKSELIAMGFDKAKIKKATPTEGQSEEQLERARNFDSSSDQSLSEISEYKVFEEYARVDRNEDDHDELIKVTRIGDTILEVEEVDEAPYVLWTPIRIPHKLTGLCPADAAMEPQKIATTLWRNQLDNQYNLNNGRPTVVEGMVDLDSLMNSAPGAPVIAKTLNGINYPNQPQFGQHTYNMMELNAGMLEATVGASDTSIDPNILNGNTAAGAVSQVLSKRQARQRMIAREFGEFLKKVFMGIHQLEIENAEDKKIFRLRGDFVEVDPRKWHARKDLSVLVGLGNGSKTEQLFHMQQTQQAQQALATSGGLGTMVMPQQIIQLQEDMVRLYDKAAEGRYFTMPPPEETGLPQGPSIDEQIKMKEVEFEGIRVSLEQKEMQLKEAEYLLEVKKFEFDQEKVLAEVKLEAESGRSTAIG